MSDLIDRAALLGALNKLAMEHHESHVPLVEHDFRELIHNAERVEVPDMSAHWCDRHGNPTGRFTSVYCSACGGWSEQIMKYCAYCGARMEDYYGRD